MHRWNREDRSRTHAETSLEELPARYSGHACGEKITGAGKNELYALALEMKLIHGCQVVESIAKS